MKLKTTFEFLFGIWLLDYLTTFYALHFLRAYETNIFASFFYAHWWGWIAFPVIAGVGLFALSLIIYSGQNFAKREFLKHSRKDFSFLIPLIGIMAWTTLEGYAIIHNLLVIFGV